MTLGNLKRIDNHAIPDDPHEVRLFCVVRNEILRLPYLLEYYRQKGIARFFFVDNGSDDGTLDYLKDQPDCHIYSTTGSFREAQAGMDWKHLLLNEYGDDQWCLSIDADEQLTWPHEEHSSLPDLCKWLDEEGSEGFYTFLMDMYPKGALSDSTYVSGTPFLKSCPFHDTDYVFLPRMRTAFWKGHSFPKNMVHGGPRLRLFYPEQKKIGNTLQRYIQHVIWDISSKLISCNIIDKKKIPHPAPTLFKIPLIKWKKGYVYKTASHMLEEPIKLSSVTGILLHFKLFPDFREKVTSACASKEYYGGSIEYCKYLEKMRGNYEKTIFRDEKSCAYSGSEDLLEMGLLKTTDSFDHYIRANTDDSKHDIDLISGVTQP